MDQPEPEPEPERERQAARNLRRAHVRPVAHAAEHLAASEPGDGGNDGERAGGRRASARRTSRVAPFAALYVLVLSILSPLASARSSVLARRLPRRWFAPEAVLETTAEPAASEPIIEVGVIRRLGAETVEHPVRRGDAAVGAHARDLGLPRDALVSVIVRGDEAVAPRGSTRIHAGDRLHIIVRREVANDVDALQTRWREGPRCARSEGEQRVARPRRTM